VNKNVLKRRLNVCVERNRLRSGGSRSIPCSRSCDAECSVSELPIGPWHDEIATACRSEDGSSGYIHSGNTLVLINTVALHWAQLVVGWVTAFGLVNSLIT